MIVTKRIRQEHYNAFSTRSNLFQQTIITLIISEFEIEHDFNMILLYICLVSGTSAKLEAVATI